MQQLIGLIANEDDLLAISANTVGLLYSEIPDINWLGIYLVRENELVLGPFQGKPACVRIPIGEGVCGRAVSEDCTQRIDDVAEFAGHIACDPASVSEIVVPLRNNGRIFAVLDIDSPRRARFSSEDQLGIEALCRQFVRRLEKLRSNLFEFI